MSSKDEARPMPPTQDAEIVRQPAQPQTALMPAPALLDRVNEAGAYALATMNGDEFERRLSAMKLMRERVERIHKEMMIPGVDYGIIPGTGKKPTLLKPGAETTCGIYRLIPDFIIQESRGDGTSSPLIEYQVRCELHLGDTGGPIVGVGYGVCHSHEVKYRYRESQRVCPACGKACIIKGKEEYGGGWICFEKKGGCKAKFKDDEPSITTQKVGRIENPDILELKNTMIKIGEKRAHVDATLRATGSSRLFTQDVEDMEGMMIGAAAPLNSPPPSRPPERPRADAPRIVKPSAPPAQDGATVRAWEVDGTNKPYCLAHTKLLYSKEKTGDNGTYIAFWCTTKGGDGKYCEVRTDSSKVMKRIEELSPDDAPTRAVARGSQGRNAPPPARTPPPATDAPPEEDEWRGDDEDIPF